MKTSDGDQVLRRCSRCKLLFEVRASVTASCLACGNRVDGMALPVQAAVGPSVRRLREEDSVPHEIHDHEPTRRR
jgi:hypothetical protein